VTAVVDELQQLIREELAVYRRLLILAEDKRKLLLERFSTDLLAIVADEEKQVERLSQLADRRRELTERICPKEPDITLEQLVERMPDVESRSGLWMLVTERNDVVDKIRELNERNQKLLEQALELTRYSIQLLTKPQQAATYARPGQTKATPGATTPTLLDRKL